jgi:glycerol-3-phosphate dehydrogenase
VTYLLRTVNQLFPDSKLAADDVIAAWAGIRPLAATHVHASPRARDHGARSASREHAITHRDDGLVSVTGGKLTTYRAMALDVLKHASQELARAGSASATPRADHQLRSKTERLPGGDLVSLSAAAHDARENRARRGRERTTHDGLRQSVAERVELCAARSFARATIGGRLAVPVGGGPTRRRARDGVHVGDVLVRRTHVAFETRDNGRAAARRIAPLMRALLGWNETETARQVAGTTRRRGIFGIDLT